MTIPSNPKPDNVAGLLSLQPMLHVPDMAQALGQFEALGGTVVFGSRDGDWSLVRFGATELSLLARPPNTEQGDTEFELNFVSSIPIESVEFRARGAAIAVFQPVTDTFFGRQLSLKLPSGLLMKINEIEADLVR